MIIPNIIYSGELEVRGWSELIGIRTSTSLHATLLEATHHISSQHWNSHFAQQLFTPLMLRCAGKNPQFEIACWDCFNYVNKMVYDAAANILESMNSFIKYPSVTRFKYLLPISSKRALKFEALVKDDWLAVIHFHRLNRLELNLFCYEYLYNSGQESPL